MDHAESLLVWLVECDLPDDLQAEDGGDPLALTLLALLVVRRNPHDPRLAGLASALDAQVRATPEQLASVRRESLRSTLWDRLITTIVGPVASEPSLARLHRWLGGPPVPS